MWGPEYLQSFAMTAPRWVAECVCCLWPGNVPDVAGGRVCYPRLAGKSPSVGRSRGVYAAFGLETSPVAPQVESRRIVCPCRVRISTAAMSRRARELAPMTVSSRLGSAFQVATCWAAPLRSMMTMA